MNYGLYLSAAGVLNNLQRQDVIANNLANITTVGFKPDSVLTRHRLPERLESGLLIEPKELLERLGGGLSANPAFVSQLQGNLIKTENDLDVAVDGEGFLLVASERAPEAAARLTRDGRMAINPSGELVMTATGMRVLDANNQPISLDPTLRIEIRSNGQVAQNDVVRATIQLVAPRDPAALTKVGNNLLRVGSGRQADLRPATGRLVQRHVESSAVNPITALSDMISAAKAAQGNIKMMQFHDHLMGQAVNTLGRVA